MSIKIIAARHFETIKNLNDIQGYSLEDEITLNGYLQCKNLAKAIEKFKPINGITYFNTPQSKQSAMSLSRISGIPVEAPLSLELYNLGIAAGISNAQLKNISLSSYESINLFRERVIPAKDIDVINSESVHDLEERLILWWITEGTKRLNNRVVIGSNSTLIMLTNLLNGNLPTSENYLCYHIHNGGFRFWENAKVAFNRNLFISENSWPDITYHRLKTEKGFIQANVHHQNWGENSLGCIICPGYFGNSRQGPYGLYSKMARFLSKHGIKTITFDYLGSGESTPIERNFQTDVFSADFVLSKLLSSAQQKVVIGHSLGSTIVSELLNNSGHYIGIALAPLHSYEALSEALLTESEAFELKLNGSINRRGVKIDQKYCSDAEESWQNNSQHLSLIINAGKDQYDLAKTPMLNSTCENIITIDDSDHNFAINNSQKILFKELLNFINGKFIELTVKNSRKSVFAAS